MFACVRACVCVYVRVSECSKWLFVYCRESQYPDFSTYVSLILHVAQLQLKDGLSKGERGYFKVRGVI